LTKLFVIFCFWAEFVVSTNFLCLCLSVYVKPCKKNKITAKRWQLPATSVWAFLMLLQAIATKIKDGGCPPSLVYFLGISLC